MALNRSPAPQFEKDRYLVPEVVGTDSSAGVSVYTDVWVRALVSRDIPAHSGTGLHCRWVVFYDRGRTDPRSTEVIG
jgi:hypothetical protein